MSKLLKAQKNARAAKAKVEEDKYRAALAAKDATRLPERETMAMMMGAVWDAKMRLFKKIEGEDIVYFDAEGRRLE